MHIYTSQELFLWSFITIKTKRYFSWRKQMPLGFYSKPQLFRPLRLYKKEPEVLNCKPFHTTRYIDLPPYQILRSLDLWFLRTAADNFMCYRKYNNNKYKYCVRMQTQKSPKHLSCFHGNCRYMFTLKRCVCMG